MKSTVVVANLTPLVTWHSLHDSFFKKETSDPGSVTINLDLFSS